jgi:hypothetical protein
MMRLVATAGFTRCGEAGAWGSVLIHKHRTGIVRLIPGPRSRLSKLAKIALVLVRSDHVASFVVNANNAIA